MTEETKNPQQAKIRVGLSAKRSPVCYQTLKDIIIPAGTILRHDTIAKDGELYSAGFGLFGKIVLDLDKGEIVKSDLFKRVIA